MTGKEIVRLIRRLRREGMTSDKILDIIEEVGAPELTEGGAASTGEDSSND